MSWSRAILVGALAAAGLVGLGAQGDALTWVLGGAAALVVLDAHTLLRRAGTASLLPVSLALAIGATALGAVGRAEGVPTLALLSLLAAFALLLAARRTSGAAPVLGATLLAGLLPGLGALGVLRLADVSRWGPLALGGLVAAAWVGRAVGRWLRAPAPELRPQAGSAVVVTGLAVALAAVGMHLGAEHGLAGEALAGLGLLAMLGVLGVAWLGEALAGGGDRLAGAPLLVAGPVMAAAMPARAVVDALS